MTHRTISKRSYHGATSHSFLGEHIFAVENEDAVT